MRTIYTSAFVLILLVKCSYCHSSKDNNTRNLYTYYDYFPNANNKKDYKLMYEAKDWKGAVKICRSDNGSLAVPRSQMEFDFLQKIVKEMYYPAVQGSDDKLVVWLGISSLDNNAVWKTVLGEDIETLPFHTWSLGNGHVSEDPRSPHCVVIDAANPGLRDYWCYMKQPFICEYVAKTRV